MEATNKKPLVNDINEDAVVSAPYKNTELIDELILNKDGNNISFTMITDLDHTFTTNPIALPNPDLSVYETKDEHNQDIDNLKNQIDTKQDKGDYALKSDIPDVSNLATKDELNDGLNTKEGILTAARLFEFFEAGDGINIELENDKIKIGVK